MHVWMWWLAVPAVLALLAAGATVGGTRRRRARAYSRRSARHVLGDPVGWPAQDFYGSMDRDAEHGWYAGAPVPLPRMDHYDLRALAAVPDWAGQTAASLSPEALDAWGPRGPSESYEAWLAEGRPDDPGPGVGSSLAPGPAPSDLGPRAALVLDRWERAFAAKWGCPWAELGALA